MDCMTPGCMRMSVTVGNCVMHDLMFKGIEDFDTLLVTQIVMEECSLRYEKMDKSIKAALKVGLAEIGAGIGLMNAQSAIDCSVERIIAIMEGDTNEPSGDS